MGKVPLHPPPTTTSPHPDPSSVRAGSPVAVYYIITILIFSYFVLQLFTAVMFNVFGRERQKSLDACRIEEDLKKEKKAQATMPPSSSSSSPRPIPGNCHAASQDHRG